MRRDAARRRADRPVRRPCFRCWRALRCSRCCARRCRSPPSAPPSTRAPRRGGGCAPTRCRACCMPARRGCAPSTSGELTATVVDRIEALDGLFARWLPAAALAIVGPLLVALAALPADPLAGARAGAVRACWCRSPWRCRHRRGGGVAQPVPGAGAAAGALPRPRARHRHHRAVRPGGGRGALARRGGRRTAPAHHARAARRLPVLGRARSCRGTGLRRAGAALRHGTAGRQPDASGRRALFVLLLVPEFFAPLRGFAAAYQDRLHATGAAEALADLPPLPAPRRRARCARWPRAASRWRSRMCISPGTRRAARR